MASHRRNSRVLKVLPHLFFTEPHVRASLYLDSESRLGGALNVSEAVREMLDGCGAGFAAQAHRTRSTQVLREFRAILDNGRTGEGHPGDGSVLVIDVASAYRIADGSSL